MLVSPMGRTVPLPQVARITLAEGPAMIRSEYARPATFVHIDAAGRDLGGCVADARAAVARELAATPGMVCGR